MQNWLLDSPTFVGYVFQPFRELHNHLWPVLNILQDVFLLDVSKIRIRQLSTTKIQAIVEAWGNTHKYNTARHLQWTIKINERANSCGKPGGIINKSHFSVDRTARDKPIKGFQF